MIICGLIGIAYYFYTTYTRIDITPEYEIKRTESTIPAETVENIEQESKTIAEVLENVSIVVDTDGKETYRQTIHCSK